MENNKKILKTANDVENEIDNIFNQKTNMNYDSISLYGVCNVLKNKTEYKMNLINNFENRFFNRTNYFKKIILDKFDINEKKISLHFYDNDDNTYMGKISFDFDNDTKIKTIGNINIEHIKKELFQEMCNESLKLYNKINEFEELEKDKSFNITPINSNFNIVLNNNKIGITNFLNDQCDYKFELSYNFIYNDYDVKNSLNNTSAFFKNKGQKLFKKVFVNIDTCPICIRKELYEERKLELNEIKRREELINAAKSIQKKKKILWFNI